MGDLECVGRLTHDAENFSIRVGVLQSLPLELNGGQGSINLLQLLLVTLLPFQRSQSS